MSRRQEAKPMLADLGREREHCETHIRTHKYLGAPYIKAAQERLVEIEREETKIYRWIAEDEH